MAAARVKPEPATLARATDGNDENEPSSSRKRRSRDEPSAAGVPLADNDTINNDDTNNNSKRRRSTRSTAAAATNNDIAANDDNTSNEPPVASSSRRTRGSTSSNSPGASSTNGSGRGSRRAGSRRAADTNNGEPADTNDANGNGNGNGNGDTDDNEPGTQQEPGSQSQQRTPRAYVAASLKTRLMSDRSTSIAERQSVRDDYGSLTQETKHMISAGTLRSTEIKEQLGKSNELNAKVYFLSEEHKDAQHLALLAEGSLQSMAVLEKKSRIPTETLLAALSKRFKDSDGEFDWQKYGQVAIKYWRTVRVPSFVNGSMDMKVEVKERKKIERKQKRELAPVVEPKKVNTAEEEKTATDQRVASLLDSLDTYIHRNKKPPLFWEFVLDPQSFTSTVQHIFDLGFLLKESRVGIEMDPLQNNGRPTLLLKDSALPRGPTISQVVMSFDYATWRDKVKEYKITAPPPHYISDNEPVSQTQASQ